MESADIISPYPGCLPISLLSQEECVHCLEHPEWTIKLETLLTSCPETVTIDFDDDERLDWRCSGNAEVEGELIGIMDILDKIVQNDKFPHALRGRLAVRFLFVTA